MTFNVIALIIGLLILIAGIYYLAKEKQDAESRKIYSITIIVGVIVTAFGLIRILM